MSHSNAWLPDIHPAIARRGPPVRGRLLWNLGGFGVFWRRNNHQQSSNTRGADTFNRSISLLLAIDCLPTGYFLQILLRDSSPRGQCEPAAVAGDCQARLISQLSREGGLVHVFLFSRQLNPYICCHWLVPTVHHIEQNTSAHILTEC